MEPGITPATNVDSPSAIARRWWDTHGTDYLADSPSIGTTHFQWCPEGWTEDDLRLLDTRGTILEVGAGSAPCSRWLASHGRQVIATDISQTMVDAALTLNKETSTHFDVLTADILSLPFEDNSFDIAFTSFGAIGFIPDLAQAFSEVARVLKPGSQWVYAATHPFSWVFPDSPHPADLSVIRPYGAREAYVEGNGTVEYAEFAHSLADHVNALAETGFVIENMIEPRWKPGHDLVWGPWGPDRGKLLPGSIIISARLASR